VISEKQALVVDRVDGMLSEVMAELDQLGFRVIWVPTLSGALEFVAMNPTLSLIVVGQPVTEKHALEFLERVKAIGPRIQIVWGIRPDNARSAPPDARVSIPPPMRMEELRKVASRLLTDYFYPQHVADAIKAAALEVLGTLGSFKIEGDAFLIGNQSVLSDLSAVIPFSGEVSGHLMLSMSVEDARTFYRRHQPNTQTPRLDRMEDLVGELCNQILGRVNSFFAEYAIAIHHTTPIFIRSAGSTMRYRGRQPSFGVELAEHGGRVFLEYYLDEIDRAKLARKGDGKVLNLGEIRYF
jgi:CheY-specific phosphatase CheX